MQQRTNRFRWGVSRDITNSTRDLIVISLQWLSLHPWKLATCHQRTTIFVIDSTQRKTNQIVQSFEMRELRFGKRHHLNPLHFSIDLLGCLRHLFHLHHSRSFFPGIPFRIVLQHLVLFTGDICKKHPPHFQPKSSLPSIWSPPSSSTGLLRHRYLLKACCRISRVASRTIVGSEGFPECKSGGNFWECERFDDIMCGANEE